MDFNQNNGSKANFGGDASFGDEEKTMPLGVGDGAEGLDPLANAGEGRKFNAGSLVIVAVIVVACGGLWFMRSLSHVSASTGDTQELDQSIDDFMKHLKTKKDADGTVVLPSFNPNDSSLLAMLSSSYIEQQVPLDDVQKNPFVLPGEDEVIPTPTGQVDDGSRTLAKRRAERQTQFEQAAAKCELKSVIMGSQPLANISGKIVRKGEVMNSEDDKVSFRITEITSDAITLVGEDAALGLTLPFKIVLKRDK